jgi:hypothetical protein
MVFIFTGNIPFIAQFLNSGDDLVIGYAVLYKVIIYIMIFPVDIKGIRDKIIKILDFADVAVTIEYTAQHVFLTLTVIKGPFDFPMGCPLF